MNKIIDTFKTLMTEIDKKDLDLLEVKELYINSRKTRVRKDTVEYYIKQITPIIDYLLANKINTTGMINNQVLDNYVVHLKNRKLSNNTVNKQLSTLRQALKYLE